jgi:hypothetical protein
MSTLVCAVATLARVTSPLATDAAKPKTRNSPAVPSPASVVRPPL